VTRIVLRSLLLLLLCRHYVVADYNHIYHSSRPRPSFGKAVLHLPDSLLAAQILFFSNLPAPGRTCTPPPYCLLVAAGYQHDHPFSLIALLCRLCVGNGTGSECAQVLIPLRLLFSKPHSCDRAQVTEPLSQSKMMGVGGVGGMSTPLFASKTKAVSLSPYNPPLYLHSVVFQSPPPCS
jgi:hypothetical protein